MTRYVICSLLRESSDKVDAGAQSTDSVGSNKNDEGTLYNATGQRSPHFVMPLMTQKTPGKGDFNQLLICACSVSFFPLHIIVSFKAFAICKTQRVYMTCFTP